MEWTNRLKLPYLMASQAQKHVTHNEAIRLLDALVQASVISAIQQSPPLDPQEGAAYIVPIDASGVFENKTDQLAIYADAEWMFLPPAEGWRVWNIDTASEYVFMDNRWMAHNTEVNTRLGINAIADDANRLSVRAPSTLLSAEGDDHRLYINKQTAADVASTHFQTNFTTHAELGLVGDNNLVLRTSADGTIFKNSMVADPLTHHVSFPYRHNEENLLINGDFRANRRKYTGANLSPNTYGYDRWQGGVNGADFSVAGNIATLGEGSIVQFIEQSLWDVEPGQLITIAAHIINAVPLYVTIGGQTKQLDPNQEFPSATFDVPTSNNGFIKVELSGDGCQFTKVRAHKGRIALCWHRTPAPLEAAYLSRYCQIIQPPSFGIFTPLTHFSDYDLRGVMRLATPMRVPPSIDFRAENDFRIVPNPGAFDLGYQSVSATDINVIAITGQATKEGASLILRSSSSALAAILLDAEISE